MRLRKHALIRIQERSKQSPEALVTLIENKKFVNIGVEPNTNRAHYLVYSDVDHQWFVFVCDESNNELVTFLPVDYHENIAWRVSIDSMIEAQGLVCAKVEDTCGDREHLPPVLTPPSVFKIQCNVFGTHKWKNLGSFPIGNHDGFKSLFGDSMFYEFIATKAKEKDLEVRNITSLLITKGRSRGWGKGLEVIDSYDVLEKIVDADIACYGENQ